MDQIRSNGSMSVCSASDYKVVVQQVVIRKGLNTNLSTFINYKQYDN